MVLAMNLNLNMEMCIYEKNKVHCGTLACKAHS